MRLGGLRHALAATASTAALTTATHAQDAGAPVFGLISPALGTPEVVQFALFAGAMTAALASALWLIRERGRTAAQNDALRAKVQALNGQIATLEALARTDGQRAIIWEDKDRKPAVIGALEASTGAPAERSTFLAFGRWLEPRSAARLEHLIADLRDEAKPFSDIIETRAGAPLEVTGRTNGSSAVVRFANLASERATGAKLALEHNRVVQILQTLKSLLDAMDAPAWLRDSNGALTWVNASYARSVQQEDAAEAVARGSELFGSQALRRISEQSRTESGFNEPVSTVVDGDRVVFEVSETPGPWGSAGIAIDQTEFDAIRSELNKTIRSHEETLDQLNTAVAMFDENARLRFYNQAFRELWGLDVAFLESVPDNTMLLDRLRAEGKLPEQPEWRRWKNGILAAYQSIEPQEHWWHLPSAQTLRVVASPHPKGGLTWVFEDLTERIDLESRYKTMVRVRGETLDHLAEGVAVFAANGKLQLANPAFARFWGIEALLAEDGVHIARIAAECGNEETWKHFAGIVTGFDDDRGDEAGRCEQDGLTLSWMIAPLPNGQTMITFVDVTASDQVERALRDRNDALERTARLRNRFVQHVSYELRTPLTNIAGFTALLASDDTGPLNRKQREYVDHISSSSDALMLIVDDILDLATIDAGIMELDFREIEIEPVMREIATALAPRLQEHEIDLAVRIDPDIGAIHADGSRLRQAVYNVLSNAADFAPEGTTVVFTGEREANGVVIKIRDHGPGIPEDSLNEIFNPFHTGKPGRRRGAGLGLSLAKSFVTLHDGRIEIQSSPERGTEVHLHFPQVPPSMQVAAE